MYIVHCTHIHGTCRHVLLFQEREPDYYRVQVHTGERRQARRHDHLGREGDTQVSQGAGFTDPHWPAGQEYLQGSLLTHQLSPMGADQNTRKLILVLCKQHCRDICYCLPLPPNDSTKYASTVVLLVF